jgi:hypothetical protein
MIREEPVRFSACTIFDGDAVVRTSCPGAGIVTASADYSRHELRKVDPAALLAAHADHVESFSREAGRAVRQVTMTEAATIDAAHDRRLLLSRPRGFANTTPQLVYLGLPSVIAFALLPRWLGSPGNRLALAICIGGAFFAYFRFRIFATLRKQRILRSHSEDVRDKPKGAS